MGQVAKRRRDVGGVCKGKAQCQASYSLMGLFKTYGTENQCGVDRYCALKTRNRASAMLAVTKR